MGRSSSTIKVNDNPSTLGRAPLRGKRRYIDYQYFGDFVDRIKESFPYLPDTEVERFINLVFHEIVEQMHEKRTVYIPFFGTFFVKPKKVFKVFRRDIWNGYEDWITLDKPIDDWVPGFEAGYYLKQMSTHRYTQTTTDESVECSNEEAANTYSWDRAYLKFKKRDQALRQCPYSTSTYGWQGYDYERIIKEGLNAGETVRLTAKDGEVYKITKTDGDFREKFRDAYEKTKYYMEEVAKRKIFTLVRRVGLHKAHYAAYSKYLKDNRAEDIKDLEQRIRKEIIQGGMSSYFYALKFGWRFDHGERERLYKGYFFNPYKKDYYKTFKELNGITSFNNSDVIVYIIKNIFGTIPCLN